MSEQECGREDPESDRGKALQVQEKRVTVSRMDVEANNPRAVLLSLTLSAGGERLRERQGPGESVKGRVRRSWRRSREAGMWNSMGESPNLRGGGNYGRRDQLLN